MAQQVDIPGSEFDYWSTQYFICKMPTPAFNSIQLQIEFDDAEHKETKKEKKGPEWHQLDVNNPKGGCKSWE